MSNKIYHSTYTAAQIQASIGKNPVIQGGYWYTWNMLSSAYQNTGVVAVGTSAGFGTPTATIDSGVGTPSVTVTASGSNTAKVFNFAFRNLKGKSAYQTAAENGYAGSESEFNKLIGGINTIVSEAKSQADEAKSQADVSKYYSEISKSWAVGGSGMRDGEDTDNSKYYAYLSMSYSAAFVSPVIIDQETGDYYILCANDKRFMLFGLSKPWLDAIASVIGRIPAPIITDRETDERCEITVRSGRIGIQAIDNSIEETDSILYDPSTWAEYRALAVGGRLYLQEVL